MNETFAPLLQLFKACLYLFVFVLNFMSCLLLVEITVALPLHPNLEHA